MYGLCMPHFKLRIWIGFFPQCGELLCMVIHPSGQISRVGVVELLQNGKSEEKERGGVAGWVGGEMAPKLVYSCQHGI